MSWSIRARIGTAVSLCLALITLAFVVVEIDLGTSNFDHHFNLQVARNLAKHFWYASEYRPVRLYDARITTNGPVQYFAALNIFTFGNVGGAYATVLGVFALFLYSISRGSRFVFVAFCILFLTWPLLGSLGQVLLGELPAVSFCLLGIQALQQKGTNYQAPQAAPVVGTFRWRSH